MKRDEDIQNEHKETQNNNKEVKIDYHKQSQTSKRTNERHTKIAERARIPQ